MTVPPPFATTPPSGLPDLIEHDACALAAFATRDGKPSRTMVELALTSLQMMVHRSGSVDGEGDGSGLLVDLPRPHRGGARLEARPRPRGRRRPALHGRAHLLRQRPSDAEAQVPRVEAVVREHGFEVLWSGEGTVDRAALGPRASETPPIFWQIACLASEPGSRGVQRTVTARWCSIERDLDCHVASFSANDAVYKVQGQPEVIPRFYPEMAEPDFTSSRIIAHNRYSTNTYPTFSRVQPFSILGHNGEINTIAQLREQSEQLGLPITRGGSDSQDLNRLLEGLIFEKGLSLLEAVEFALPPILGEVHRLPAKLQDLYVHYREALGPYAQGPVGLACRASRRDGVRGGRDGPAPAVVDRDRRDLRRLVRAGHRAGRRADPRPRPPRPRREGRPGHRRRRRAASCSTTGSSSARSTTAPRAAAPCPPRRRARAWPAASTRSPSRRSPTRSSDARSSSSRPSWPRPAGSRATSSSSSSTPTAAPSRSARSGWDGPLGPFTPVPMPLSDYLQETVAVVTNPAIDREREVEHFSTRVVLGRRPPIEGVEPEPPQRCELRMPHHPGRYARRRSRPLSLPELRRVAVGPRRGVHGGRARRVGLAGRRACR